MFGKPYSKFLKTILGVIIKGNFGVIIICKAKKKIQKKIYVGKTISSVWCLLSLILKYNLK